VGYFAQTWLNFQWAQENDFSFQRICFAAFAMKIVCFQVVLRVLQQ